MMNNMDMILMLIYSFIIGYIFSMALLADRPSNITNNINKIYMALLMASSMGSFDAVQMLSNDYSTKNIGLFVFFVAVTIYLVIAIKNQFSVNQEQFLLSMIEHHAAAIRMAEKVKPKITDKRVGSLVNEIISSQDKEINLMKTILRDGGYHIDS